MIILNISPIATHKLDLTNNDISFTGRFAGSAMEIWVPVKNVLAIFAKETRALLSKNTQARAQKCSTIWNIKKRHQRERSSCHGESEKGSKKKLNKRKLTVGKKKVLLFSRE